ncbi:fatty acid desaturase [Sphingomonas sp.]|jgi:beta-carotene ketolase (CrtW type)|uniref:fatty acid desaturase n=1 Tax=Sphingomonas sp. TaxID=28214 RepID=UPI002DEF6A37|nr:fatty acid desaturase [Sphingomonas sp.]HEV2568988.1 fatty acid desaturase [Sphingomonas sp.]
MMSSAVSTTQQRRIGLTLAAAIMAAWLTVHIGGIFFWRLELGHAPALLAVILLQAWLSTGLFIIAHDAMHAALAPGQPRLNRGIGTLALAFYAGLSYRQLAPKHALHHRHVGTEGDPDFHAPEPTRALPWFLSFFRSYYTHGQLARITLAAIVYLLLGAGLLNIVIFWAVPALLALWQLFFFGTYLPHRHEQGGFADHHRARSTRLSPWLSLVTCFHFGGYHHEHHLHPATPWWRLPRLRRELG